MAKIHPLPRQIRYLGMQHYPRHYRLGGWLEPEEACYPYYAMVRRAYAINVDTGKLQVVRCGVPDTWFSIPAVGGYLTVSDGDILRFHPNKSQPQLSDPDTQKG